MTTIVKDPLLALARAVLIFLIAVLGIACAAVTVAAAGVALFPGKVLAQMAAQGQPATGHFVVALVGLLAVAGVVLGLTVYVLLLLRQIVNSVGEGDPFVPANADRLSRMAWVTVIAEVASGVLGSVSHWIDETTPGVTQNIHSDVSFGGGGILLILTLFILARVFRKGAEMRADLEGTV